MADQPVPAAELVRCQVCHEPTFDLVAEVCRSCGAVPLAPLKADYWRRLELAGDHLAYLAGQAAAGKRVGTSDFHVACSDWTLIRHPDQHYRCGVCGAYIADRDTPEGAVARIFGDHSEKNCCSQRRPDGAERG